VGGPKSGTHSIATIFHRGYRAEHEPKSSVLIPFLLKKEVGLVSESECRDFILKRDEFLSLEMESNHLLYFFIEELVSAFPEAKFVLTIRDCYSFVDSMINHMLPRRFLRVLKYARLWKASRDVMFNSLGTAYEEGEEAFARHHVYPLRGYLAHWTYLNEKILSIVPKDRLLIVRTKDIRQRLPEIAQFVGADFSLLDTRRTHTFRARWKYHLVEQLDRAFLERSVDRYCRPLMDRFYPEIRSLEDAIPGTREPGARHRFWNFLDLFRSGKTASPPPTHPEILEAFDAAARRVTVAQSVAKEREHEQTSPVR
jgi:hypothetical protein